MLPAWASTSASTGIAATILAGHGRRADPSRSQGARGNRHARLEASAQAGADPGVLYGRSEPHSIAIPERELRRALTSDGGLNAILDVVLEGQKTTHPSILKEYQQDPVKGRVTHVDFQEVRLDKPIHATVPVHLVGAEDSPGIREGGVLSQIVARRQRRGAADGDPRAPRSRRQRHGDERHAPPVRSARARRRHAARRSRGDGARVGHDAGARGRARAGRGRGAKRARWPRARKARPPRAQRANRPAASRARRARHPRGARCASSSAGRTRLVARPARRRPRQSGPRVRAEPPQRRLDGGRRARTPARRQLRGQVLRPARRGSRSATSASRC